MTQECMLNHVTKLHEVPTDPAHRQINKYLIFLIPIMTFYICMEISNKLRQTAIVAHVPSYLFQHSKYCGMNGPLFRTSSDLQHGTRYVRLYKGSFKLSQRKRDSDIIFRWDPRKFNVLF